MFRRRQTALFPSLAVAAAVGLVGPAAAGVVVAESTPPLDSAAGEANAQPAVEPPPDAPVVEEQVAEPAAEPVDAPTTTQAPNEEPAAEPATEATTTTTELPSNEPVEPTTTTAPADEPTGNDGTTEPTTTTTAPADEPGCDTTADTAAEAATDPVTESATTTTAPADEPTCDPNAPSDSTPPDNEPEPTTTTAPTDAANDEPAVDPQPEPTSPTTEPAPADEPVGGSDDDDGATAPPSEDQPSDGAAADEEDQPAESATGQGDGEPLETADRLDAPEAPAPIDTTPAEVNAYDPGLRASSYDGVYAEGVPVGVAMSTTRWLESGNRYDAQARGSTASGAYQILDSTWNGYGGYPRAVLAPPEVQDQFAYEAFTALLKRHGNDVSTIPVSWYIGHVPQGAEWDTVPHPEAGNTLTPRQYQAKWMKKFFSLLSEGAPVYLPSDTDALIPAIAFPVLGPVEFVDDWHFDRDGGARRHEGLDLLGYEGQPIRAAFDGVITAIDDVPSGIAGNGLRLTRDDGLYANYFHLSNSETGPVHAALEVGTRVRAGQIIGFMGSTGNAGIPHLHFELRTAEREPMAPYPAVLEAVQREQCAVGLGPWSTEFMSPAAKAAAEAEAAAALAGLTAEEVEALAAAAEAAADEVEYVTIEGPDGAQWVIGTDGSVTASGQAAMIGSYQADCPMPIETVDEHGDPIMYGTGAEGLPVDEVPVGWWDDEAVEWTPDLDDDEHYVDPWKLDQAELDDAGQNHVEQAEADDPLGDRRRNEMI